MSIQFNPSAKVANSLDIQAVAQQRATAFDTSNSSLVSMSQPQEGVIGDLFSGVWSVVTWPFRTVASIFSKAWNWVFGTSAANPAVTDPVADFTAAIKAKKFKTDDFKAAFAALSTEDQKAFKTLMWVAGGHSVGSGGDWSGKIIDKKKYSDGDKNIFKDALSMMDAKAKLADFAQRLGEEGLKNSKEAKKDCYDGKALPEVVKEQVKVLGSILATGDNSSAAHFLTAKSHVNAYKRACEILAENNFVLLPDVAARREMQAMFNHLTAVNTRHSTVQPHDVAGFFNGLSEKSAALLAEVVGSAASVAARTKVDGAAYLRGTHPNKNGTDLVAPDCDLVLAALQSIVDFDKR